MHIETEILYRLSIALVAALAISFLMTPIVMKMAYKVGAIDVPKDARRMHTHPIPRLGGFAIFLGFVISVLFFADIDRQLQGILLGAVIIVIIGVIDDITPLPALFKFAVQIIAAIVVVCHGVVIETIANPNIFSSSEFISFGIWAYPITVIWIVAVTNSVNLIDGLDGLAVGVSTIAAVSMLIIALIVTPGNLTIVLAALVGACVGFVPYNKNPAKIFMGDTGALFLGFILATVSVAGLFKYYAVITFVVPFVILGLPIFDTAFAFFRRLLKGQSPMKPDRKHFHHRLIDMGLSQKQAVTFLYLISAIMGVIAIVMTTSDDIRALILICMFMVVGIIVYFIKGKHEPREQLPVSDDSQKSDDSEDKNGSSDKS